MVKQLITLLFLTSPYTFSQLGDSLLSGTQNPPVDSIITSIPDILPGQDSLSTPLITEKPDTISPIQGQPLTSTSTIIERQTFLFTNYRYTGDLLRSFPLYFIKDQGFIGQPNESFIYGIGNNGVSYLRDGVLWNNRFTNSLDLNHMQSEDIDSIEIVPSPRGFLYGPYNNPVTVNFISRDFASPEPYSRLKYYEGPSGEAMIDGLFNANIFKRWNIGLQVTNRKFDSTYTNSEFSTWQINSKLKYFLSNSVNISAYYGYVDSKVGLNGGVDVDSISRITSDINSILYEPLRAPVVSPNQKLETLQHNFVLRTLAKPFDKSILDLSLYYKYGLDETRNFQDSINTFKSLESKALGGLFNYFQRFGVVSFQLFSSYESNNFSDKANNTYQGISVFQNDEAYDHDIFNLGGIFSLYLLSDNLQTSLFYKYNNSLSDGYQSNRSGQGIDIKYELWNKLSFYLGVSRYENYELNDAGAFEAGAMFNYNNLFIDFKYFDSDYNLFKPEIFSGPSPAVARSLTNIKGIGIGFNYKLWMILLETNFSYYDLNNSISSNLPDYQFIGGLLVNDLFFENNLDLKAGFKFYYIAEFSAGYYFYEGDIRSEGGVEPTNKIDFTLAGEIKKLAIFYFIWENILNKQYYITPYYPMPESNLRFGIAWELFN